ncbi:hypothetical protein NL676_038950 [Syzygium grande]|nr:hypothetical protein NL676_038950 [Syzygium grande]
MMKSLMEASFQLENQLQAFSREFLQLLQPASVSGVRFQGGPPVPIEFWPTTELQMSIAAEEKKGVGENKTNGSLVAPEKPMLPPSVKCYSKDEEPRFEKVKQETPAKSIKPECISLDETATGAKHGQIYTF